VVHKVRASLVAAILMVAASSFAQTVRPVSVQPSGNEIPANLLRISLIFSSPVSRSVLPHLGLREADGRVIEQPFLEQELWSPSGKILTVLLHPGRVKSGLIAHDTVGPVLRSRQSVLLLLDGKEVKRWNVGEDDIEGPKPSSWKLAGVRAGTRQPLLVDLDEAIEGRDVDYLAVADKSGHRVAGAAQLTRGEKRWTFVPTMPWRAGAYRLAVFANLEDPAGNRLGTHFEQTASESARPAQDVALPFSAR
jgi:hypothetical protein